MPKPGNEPGRGRRRQAATPAAGLGVLGLLARAFSGGGGKPAPVPHTSPAAGEPGGRRSPDSVVLSLFSGSRSYLPGQNPQSGVNAVSAALGARTFDPSPTQLHLVVMSAGRVIWDSADCARGPAASRWPPRPAPAATRRRPGRPPSAAARSPSNWSGN